MLGAGDPRYSSETQRTHKKKLANEEKAADPRYQHREEQKYQRQEHGGISPFIKNNFLDNSHSEVECSCAGSRH